MSKYNLFKGKARGSIGDVTFTVLNDTQVAKVRNRHPRNPRTDAQMFQRAVWATIMRIYSAGKSFFSQSFEEAATPQQNMNAFTSLNIQYLRELLTQEIEQQTPINEQLGRVVHPKASTPIPLPGLIISQGTLQDDVFTINPADDTDYLSISIPAPLNDTETIQQYATRIGLSPSIVYTFVIFLNDPTTIVAKVNDIYNDYATQYAAYFDTLQLTCRQDLPNKPMSAATIGDIFDISSPYNIFTPSVADIAIGNATLPITTILRRNTPAGTFGISAYHTTTQQTKNTTMQPISIINNYGIATQYIENAWFTDKKQPSNINVTIPEIKIYDYEHEYIEVRNNNSKAFINTNFLITIRTKIKSKFMCYDGLNNYCGLIGVRFLNTTNGRMLIVCPGKNENRIGAMGSANYGYQIYDDKKIHEIEWDIYNKWVIFDNNTYNLTNANIVLNSEPKLYLFFSNGYPETVQGYAANGRIYYIEFYENKQLIMKLIPVSKKGIPYMYDKIKNILFPVSDPSLFTLGEII